MFIESLCYFFAVLSHEKAKIEAIEVSHNPDDFFTTPRENSLVKTAIVSKFFETWANVILQILLRQERNYGRAKEVNSIH